MLIKLYKYGYVLIYKTKAKHYVPCMASKHRVFKIQPSKYVVRCLHHRRPCPI